MRMTRPMVEVAIVLTRSPTSRHWGYELSKQAGVRSGVLYPLLTRLLDAGWVKDGWEDPNTIQQKRPPRRYYELTPDGRMQLAAVVERARGEERFKDLVKKADERLEDLAEEETGRAGPVMPWPEGVCPQ